jgi:hypothetical protein
VRCCLVAAVLQNSAVKFFAIIVQSHFDAVVRSLFIAVRFA